MIMNQEHQPNELNYNRDSGFKTLMLFRCTKRKYAEDFVSGKIYFGCPQKWIDIEKKGNKGQGDILEGVFFATSIGSNSDDTIVKISL